MALDRKGHNHKTHLFRTHIYIRRVYKHYMKGQKEQARKDSYTQELRLTKDLGTATCFENKNKS